MLSVACVCMARSCVCSCCCITALNIVIMLLTGARGWQRGRSLATGPALPARPTTSPAALTASAVTHLSERLIKLDPVIDCCPCSSLVSRNCCIAAAVAQRIQRAILSISIPVSCQVVCAARLLSACLLHTSTSLIYQTRCAMSATYHKLSSCHVCCPVRDPTIQAGYVTPFKTGKFCCIASVQLSQ